MKLTSYCGDSPVLEMGEGLLVQKFVRFKEDGSYGYSCSEYLVFNNRAG